MKRNENDVTASLEDYLETIYFLNGKKGTVRVTDIAVEMDISKPSVNRAINTLKTHGLVEHEHYGTLFLTDQGMEIAKSVADRHVKLKKFLMEIIGVEEETAENEACLIEHHLSSDTISKISQYTDHIIDTKKQ